MAMVTGGAIGIGDLDAHRATDRRHAVE